MSDNAPLDASGVETATGELRLEGGMIVLSSGLVAAGHWFRPGSQTVMQVAHGLKGQRVTVTYRLDGLSKVAVGIAVAT